MEVVEKSPEDVRSEETHEGEGKADLHPLRDRYLVTPERKEEEIRPDADPEPDEDIQEGLGRGSAFALASPETIQLPYGGACTKRSSFLLKLLSDLLVGHFSSSKI